MMIWKTEYGTYSDPREAAERIVEMCDEDYFDDMLDECYDEVKICGMSYAPAIALYRLDPVAYRCARCEWEDAEAGDIAYMLERMNDGETDTFYGVEVEAVEVSGDDEEA